MMRDHLDQLDHLDAAAELRCRVVGEGGNLGVTRAARIEFSMGGRRVNADFIATWPA
jgi:NAD-specific glutamate dehydrogenase